MQKELKEDENLSLMFVVVEEDLFALVKWWVDGVATSCSFMVSNILNEEEGTCKFPI